ncbi:MAG: hypothetical protein IKB72_01960 [Ruminococcus sp.]|nr:hypothetical protein [Ruminococcus sp.]
MASIEKQKPMTLLSKLTTEEGMVFRKAFDDAPSGYEEVDYYAPAPHIQSAADLNMNNIDIDPFLEAAYVKAIIDSTEFLDNFLDEIEKATKHGCYPYTMSVEEALKKKSARTGGLRYLPDDVREECAVKIITGLWAKFINPKQVFRMMAMDNVLNKKHMSLAEYADAPAHAAFESQRRTYNKKKDPVTKTVVQQIPLEDVQPDGSVRNLLESIRSDQNVELDVIYHERVDDFIKSLSEDERKLLKALRYDVPVEDTATEFGVTPSAISQRKKKLFQKFEEMVLL